MDQQSQIPPTWPSRFLEWFCKPEYYEDLQGDLEEEYCLMSTDNSAFKAKSWYTWQIIRLFRPSMTRKLKPQDSIEKEITMFRNYLKIGFRNLLKYKSSSLINILGLSTGLASFILIALFVMDELSYDKHFQDSENIYRVTVKNFTTDGELSRHWAFASAGHATRLKEDYSSITHATRFHPWAFPDIQFENIRLPAEQVIFADDDVFDIFNFKFIIGNPNNAFDNIYSLVLTEASAIRIFGNDWKKQNILDNSVTLSRGGQEAPFKITGVMENMPDQQHFHFEYLAPIRFLELLMGEQTLNFVGGNYNWLTYVKVAPGTNIPSLTKRANDEFWDKYISTFSGGREARDFYDFEFQPLLDIHLLSNLEGEIETNGSVQQVYIFGIVGLLVLLVACINYMNIATSHYSRRMKEVGVRKVIGAFKSTLVKQFLTESILITIISLPIVVLLVYWALPYINDFTDKRLLFNPFKEIGLSLGLVGLMLGVGFVAGLYPAVFLSRMNLVSSLKGEQAMNSGKWNFRSWLVAFQYAVTIALIFSILVIDGQMKYIRNTNPGYQRDQILHLSLSRNISSLDIFKKELTDHPNVIQGSYASRIPTGRLMDNGRSAFYKGDSLTPSNFRLPIIRVDEDFLSTFEIPLIAGENFKREQDARIDSVGYYIINRAAAKAFGFNEPNDIIGKRLSYGDFNGQPNSRTGRIMRIGRIQGVMEDFHFESLHTEIVPMVMMKSANYRRIALKIKPDDIPATLRHVEETWARFDEINPVNYRFVDDLFNDQYQQEERLSNMIKVFATIAILIGCLGLIGMVGFIIETKLKEIGIRKVLGASSQSILMIISNRFIVLIVIAFALALPLSYWLMNGWLENFVYRTNISIIVIGLPFVLSAVLTFIVISYQTIKASRVNPVECLKNE